MKYFLHVRIGNAWLSPYHHHTQIGAMGIGENLVNFYMQHSRQPLDVVRKWFSDGLDHYFTAREAKEAGLIDEVFSDLAGWPQCLFAPEAPKPGQGAGSELELGLGQKEGVSG